MYAERCSVFYKRSFCSYQPTRKPLSQVLDIATLPEDLQQLFSPRPVFGAGASPFSAAARAPDPNIDKVVYQSCQQVG